MERENTVKQFLNEEIKNEVLDDNMEKQIVYYLLLKKFYYQMYSLMII